MQKLYRYGNTLVNVMATIEEHFHLPRTEAIFPDYFAQLAQAQKQVVILVDGMGWHLLPQGKEYFINSAHDKKEIDSIMPPTTVAATNAFLSGRFPGETGFFGWTQYSKELNTNIVVFRGTDYLTEEKIIDELVKTEHQQIIARLNEKSIKASEIFPAFRPGGYRDFDHLMELVKESLDDQFTYIYLPEFDADCHEFGVNSKEAATALKRIDGVIEKIYQLLPPKTILTVIADHGLVDVTGVDINNYPLIKECVIADFSWEGRCATFFLQKGKEEQFVLTFKKQLGQDFELLSQKEVLEQKIFGPVMKEGALQYLGDYVAIARGDKCLTTSAFCWQAAHAGISRQEMAIPLLIWLK